MSSNKNNIETDILGGGLVMFHMNDKIRLDILKFYYDLYKKNPIQYGKFDNFAQMFGITENELLGHIKFLNDKELLKCNCVTTGTEYGKPLYCQITAHGIDAIEHPEQNVHDLPLLNLIIHGNVINSQIFQAETIKIENGFNQVYEAIESANLDTESKKELVADVKSLESEGLKDKPNIEKMKSLRDKSKKIWSPVYDLLKPLMQECIKRYWESKV